MTCSLGLDKQRSAQETLLETAESNYPHEAPEETSASECDLEPQKGNLLAAMVHSFSP